MLKNTKHKNTTKLNFIKISKKIKNYIYKNEKLT